MENSNNFTLDLQKLFLCDDMCFFDPELYDSCVNVHSGDINDFNAQDLQENDELVIELENYPEFQTYKSFN